MARSAGEESAQTSLRLPRELYDRLQTATEGRPLGEEIRRRLEASFSDQPAEPSAADEKTARFLQQVAQLAAIVSEHYGTWHESPRAYAIFKRAVELGLPDYDPKVWDKEGNYIPPLEPSVEQSEAEKQDIEDKAFMAAATAGFVRVW